jgi:hypothetical protein
MSLLAVVHQTCADPRVRPHIESAELDGHDIAVVASALVLFPYTNLERTNALAPHHPVESRKLAARSAASLLQYPPEAAKRFLASVEADPVACAAMEAHCRDLLPTLLPEYATW